MPAVDLLQIAVAAGLPLFCYCLYHLLAFLRQQLRLRRCVNQFPCPPGHWFYGNLHNLDSCRWLTQRLQEVEQYQPCFALWNGPLMPELVLAHPDWVKPVLKSGTDGKGYAYELFLKPLGSGLLLLKGTAWHERRRLLTPAFHFQLLRQQHAVFNDASRVLVDKLDRLIGSSDCAEIEAFSIMSLFTMDVILQCAFSYCTDCQTDGQNSDYIKAVSQLSALIFKRALQPLHYIAWLYRLTSNGRQFKSCCELVHKTARDIIARRRAQLAVDGPPQADTTEADGSRRQLDFLDSLLAAQLSDAEVQDEVHTFLFAGHDTTASALSWGLYALACHPDEMRLVQAELDDVIGCGDVCIDAPQASRLCRMTQCIRESHRLYPPVPVIGRILDAPIDLHGRHLPAGLSLAVPIYSLHRSRHLWDAPDEFRPDRFADQSPTTTSRDPFAFLPFSAGPRNCIGQGFALAEERVVMAHLLRRFSFELAPGAQPPLACAEIVLRSRNGIRLLVRRR